MQPELLILDEDYHKGRRGGKRACLAVGHRILRIVHRLLRTRRPYEEAGLEYYRPADQERLKDKLIQRLRKLGYSVTTTLDQPGA